MVAGGVSNSQRPHVFVVRISAIRYGQELSIICAACYFYCFLKKLLINYATCVFWIPGYNNSSPLAHNDTFPILPKTTNTTNTTNTNNAAKRNNRLYPSLLKSALSSS